MDRIWLGGAQTKRRRFTITPNTLFILAGVGPPSGSKPRQIEEVIAGVLKDKLRGMFPAE